MWYVIWLIFLLELTKTEFCHGKQDSQNVTLKDCSIDGHHPHLVVTYKNITTTVDKLNVQNGEKVTARCKDLGKYKLIGDTSLQCRNGLWNTIFPSCIPTTAIANYTDDVPPTIVYGLPAGSGAVEPSGALTVFPGSILHLECLFARKLGNPEWTWTSTYRQYLTGWAIQSFEKNWKYRLSIYYAKPQDSGIYTCTTPKGLTNSIMVKVVGIHCSTLKNLGPPLISKIEGTRIGENAIFECPNGYRMDGLDSITCQYNGKWTGKVPKCEAIVCPHIQLMNGRLQLVKYNNTFGGLAIFSCLWGHRMRGSQILQCTSEGVWSGSMPTCSEIVCPLPAVPKNARIIENEQKYNGKKRERLLYKVGSLVRYSCLPSHQLIGHNSIICTENGTWSHEPPICEVRCPYPGDPPNGKIMPLKFWYKSGDTIQVYCAPGFVTPLEPVHRPTCQVNGIWTGPPPPCRSYRDVRR